MGAQIFLLGAVASISFGLSAVASVLGVAAWSNNRALVARLVHKVEPHLRISDLSEFDVRVEKLLATLPLGRDFLRDLGQMSDSVRPGRLVLYGLTAAGAAFAASMAQSGRIPVGVLAAVGALGAEYAFVRWRAFQRWNLFRLQLPEALHVISSALCAGASLNQALKHAAREMVPPLQSELQRVVEDVEVGKTLEEALTDLKARVPLAEFDMVIASLLIQQRSGGNLGELLNEAAHLIKQNEELRQEMQVLTSQAKASARLISLLPVGLFAYLLVTNRSYIEPLLSTGMGNSMLVVGGACMAVGYMVVMRISTYTEFEE